MTDEMTSRNRSLLAKRNGQRWQTGPFFLMIISILVISSSSLWAQDSNLRVRARQLTSEGQQLQKQGHYLAAEAKYKQAYKLLPHPVLLFNIGQVNRLAGKKIQAVRYYRQFVAIGQNDSLVKEAQQHLDVLEPQVGNLPDTETLEPTTDSPGPPGDTSLATPSSGGLIQFPPDNLKAEELDQEENSRVFRFSAMALAGIGTAMIGGGVYYGLRARKFSNQLSKISQEAWTDVEVRKDQKGKTAQRNMFILSIAGGGAIATGAILYYVYVIRHKKKSPTDESITTLVPSINGNGLSMVVSGSF